MEGSKPSGAMSDGGTGQGVATDGGGLVGWSERTTVRVQQQGLPVTSQLAVVVVFLTTLPDCILHDIAKAVATNPWVLPHQSLSNDATLTHATLTHMPPSPRPAVAC